MLVKLSTVRASSTYQCSLHESGRELTSEHADADRLGVAHPAEKQQLDAVGVWFQPVVHGGSVRIHDKLHVRRLPSQGLTDPPSPVIEMSSQRVLEFVH